MAFSIAFSNSVDALQQSMPPSVVDFPLSVGWELIAEAVGGALSRGETHYTDRPGILPLRKHVTSMLAARFQLDADAQSRTIITCGVVEARFVALQQMLAPGRTVWSPESVRNRYSGAAILRRAVPAESAATASLVCLASSLGEQALRSSMEEVSAATHIFFEIDEEGSAFHPAQVPGFAWRTATAGTLGLASWQMGYLVAPAESAPALRDFKQALTICSTNLSQWAALAAMEGQ